MPTNRLTSNTVALPIVGMHEGEKRLVGRPESRGIKLENTENLIRPFQPVFHEIEFPAAEIAHPLRLAQMVSAPPQRRLDPLARGRECAGQRHHDQRNCKTKDQVIHLPLPFGPRPRAFCPGTPPHTSRFLASLFGGRDVLLHSRHRTGQYCVSSKALPDAEAVAGTAS